MSTTNRVTRHQIKDDASSSKTMKIDDVGPRSYLIHDVLLLVMMQLGAIDFIALSGVCKSWRSVSVSYKKTFMASKPPMLMDISPRCNNNKDRKCRLEDSEGRVYKTTLTHSAGMYYIGLTCGYLILFRMKTNKDFWLVNLITRHKLNFPPAPWMPDYVSDITSVLIFSPLISKLVFVVLAENQIWFSIEDEGTWNCVSSTFVLKFCRDLHVFKGKIYTVDTNNFNLCEFTINPEPKVTLLETKILVDDPHLFFPQLVSCCENLYVMQSSAYGYVFNVYKHGFFISEEVHGAAVKPELWADPWSQYPRCDVDNGGGHGGLFLSYEGWYFPHESVNVNLLDES